jgi:8-oxo-dGTP diphosphatase
VLDADGRVLLSRRGVPPFLGCWDIPGGFVVPGETLEDAVRRELREEAGVELVVGRLVATVPDVYGDGGDPTINAFFECRIAAGVPQPHDDVTELRWFDPGELPPPEELAFDCVRAALAAWRADSGA